MAHRLKTLASLLLFSAGGILLALTFTRPGAAEAEMPNHLEPIQVPVDLAPFERESAAEWTALFLMDTNLCPPSLGEVDGYAALIEELRREGVRIEPVAVLAEADTAAAVRFMKTARLPLEARHVAPDQFPGELLETSRNRLVFIDRSRATAAAHLPLLAGSTPETYKRAMLDAALTR